MKSLNTQVTGGTTYTAAFLASLGSIAYMPGKEDINSQELDIFEVYDDSSVKDQFGTVMDGGIVTNLQYMSGFALAGEDTSKKDTNEGQEKDATKDADANSGTNKLVIMSPGKVTCKATTSSGIPQEALHGQHNLMQGLIQQWVDKQGSKALPPELAALGEHVGIKATASNSYNPNHIACQGQCSKSSPAQEGGAPRMVFRGQRFVLTGTWPGLEGRQSFIQGKESVKTIIERHRGGIISELLLEQHSSDRGQPWPQESPRLP